MIAARRPGVEYEVEAGEGVFYILTNEGAKNFKVMTAPVADPSAQELEGVAPAPRATSSSRSVMPFKHHVVVQERREGLRRLRVTALADGATHDVSFPEAAYGVFAHGGTRSTTAATLRFTYSSLVTPNTVFDYEMDARTRELKKRTEVLGGYDPAKYGVERLYATARDGTKVPISLVYKKPFVRDGKRPLLLYAYGSYGVDHRADVRLAALLAHRPRLRLRDRARARRPGDGARLVRRREDAEEDEHLHRLHRRGRPPREGALHRARPARGERRERRWAAHGRDRQHASRALQGRSSPTCRSWT